MLAASVHFGPTIRRTDIHVLLINSCDVSFSRMFHAVHKLHIELDLFITHCFR